MGEAARQSAMRLSDLQNEISTLEATKQALQREMALKVDVAARMKADLEETIAKLQGDVDTKKKEADEWEEVALNTKRDGEAQARRLTVTNQELAAQNETLEQTKRAIVHEHEVKTEIHNANKAELEQKVTQLESELSSTQKKAAENTESWRKERTDLKAQLDAMQREADEWQDVAVNTKRSGEDAARTAAATPSQREQHIEEMTITITSLRTEIVQFTTQLNTCNAESSGREQKYQALMAEKAALEAKCVQLERE